MNQNVVAYLQENKNKYSQDSLVDQLEKNGYSQKDIREGVLSVYGSMVPVSGAEKGSNFWNFSAKKVYTKSSEKWMDFLFGFFAPFLVGIVSFFIPLIGPLLALIFCIIALIYFFKRRRFIFYGLITNVVVVPIIIYMLILVMFGVGLRM